MFANEYTPYFVDFTAFHSAVRPSLALSDICCWSTNFTDRRFLLAKPMSFKLKIVLFYVLITGKYLFPSLCHLLMQREVKVIFKCLKLNVKRKRVHCWLEFHLEARVIWNQTLHCWHSHCLALKLTIKLKQWKDNGPTHTY